MSRLDCITDFASLPVYAQALVAMRMVRRAVLAKLAPADSETQLMIQAFDAAEACCTTGKGVYQSSDLFDRVMALRDLTTDHSQRQWLRQAMWYAIDALRAADACQERDFESTVTRSAQTSIAALGEDENLSRMQITILLAADIDQMLFACGEVDKLPSQNLASKYEGLGSHVMGRLAPAHALSFVPRQPSPEELAR